MSETVWPTELRVSSDKDMLTASFDDGTSFELPAEMLRVMSPSAEVQGHSPEQRVTVGGKKHVQIMRVDAVGNYAVKIAFDDMHDTGIYSWSYLHMLGMEKEDRWSAYLEELAEKSLTRER